MNIENPDKFRKKLCSKLNKYVKNKKKSINLEKGIFNYSIKESKIRKVIRKWDNQMFILIYLDKFRSVFMNLTKNKSKILKSLLKNEFKPHELASMTHQEIEPKKWKEIIEMKIKRDKSATTIDLSAATDMYTC